MLYYNNEIKEKYMVSLGAACDNTIREYFEQASVVESEKGKDIALFDAEEWFEFLKSIDVITINQVARRTAVFTKYAAWYYDQYKLKTANEFVNIAPEMMISYTTEIVNAQKYIPKDMLLKMIAEIPNAADRFMILCLYEGVKGDEYDDIQLLKLEDIDIENRIFHLHSGRDVKVSEELLETALLADQQKSYITSHSPFSEIKVSSTRVIDSDYVFKGRENMNAGITHRKRIHKRFLYLKDFFENAEFTTARILDSGLTYAIYDLMKVYGATEFKEIYGTQELVDLQDRFGHSGSEPRILIRNLKRKGYL